MFIDNNNIIISSSSSSGGSSSSYQSPRAPFFRSHLEAPFVFA